MSKISEQKALGAYPICNCYNEQCMMQEDVNFELRTGYEEGFGQAFPYFIEKASNYLFDNLPHTWDITQTISFIDNFKNYIQNE